VPWLRTRARSTVLIEHGQLLELRAVVAQPTVSSQPFTRIWRPSQASPYARSHLPRTSLAVLLLRQQAFARWTIVGTCLKVIPSSLRC